jgi:hypothetical protein
VRDVSPSQPASRRSRSHGITALIVRVQVGNHTFVGFRRCLMNVGRDLTMIVAFPDSLLGVP